MVDGPHYVTPDESRGSGTLSKAVDGYLNEGSMESLYEPVKEGDDTQVYAVPSRPCSREVLPDEDTKWHGSAKSASMEHSRFHHDGSKKKKIKTLTPKSTSGTIDDTSCCHNIYWQAPKKGEDLVLIRGNQKGEMWKDAPRTEPKTEEKRMDQLTSRRGKKELVVEVGGFQAWTPNWESPHSGQQKPAGHALVEMANSRGKTKMAQNAPRVKKAGSKSHRKNKSVIENNAHVQDCKPMSENLVVSCISMARRQEKKPYTEAPEQAQEQPFLALDLWWNTSAPPGQQSWSNLVEGPLPWSASYHTCRRALTECQVYAGDFTLPRKDCHWMCSGEHPPPCVMRSITDLDLYDSSRSTSFGKFEAFKHHPSPVKTEDGGTGEHDEKSGDESDQSKAGSLGKKMRAISLTMRMKMYKKHPKASDVTSEDVEGDHEDDAGSHHHSEEEHLKTNSVESLHSEQSSSRGVTSGSNPSSNRDSLRHEHDSPYTGNFCGRARVHTNFVPSPYDTDSLKLKEGDIIDIISKTPMGIWTGMLNNKVGTFKFIYVDLIDETVTEEPKIRRNRRSKRPRPKTLQELLERLNLEEYASSLLLNGYQTVEDLKDLKEKHLIELNVTDPEHRQKLLAAAECLQYPENDNHLESEDAPSDCQKLEPSEYPRDSGCYVSLECSDNGKED